MIGAKRNEMMLCEECCENKDRFSLVANSGDKAVIALSQRSDGQCPRTGI